MEKVSIVIPVYNTEKYLSSCIDSLLSQTYKNLEIIAVENGSTDSSPEILQTYSNKIKIVTKSHGGIASAVNLGIQKTTGEWIKKCDSDDILHGDAIDVLMDATKLYGKDALNYIFYTYFKYVDENENELEVKEPNYNELPNFDVGVILLDHAFVSQNTSIYHKSIFEKCGFLDENAEYVEDYEFSLRCNLLFGYKLHLIPKITYTHRRYSTSTSQVKAMKLHVNGIKARNLILNKLEPNSKEKYLKALKKYQHNVHPLHLKTLRSFRDFLIDSTPNCVSEKIFRTYTNFGRLIQKNKF